MFVSCSLCKLDYYSLLTEHSGFRACLERIVIDIVICVRHLGRMVGWNVRLMNMKHIVPGKNSYFCFELVGS